MTKVKTGSNDRPDLPLAVLVGAVGKGMAESSVSELDRRPPHTYLRGRTSLAARKDQARASAQREKKMRLF